MANCVGSSHMLGFHRLGVRPAKVVRRRVAHHVVTLCIWRRPAQAVLEIKTAGGNLLLALYEDVNR